MSKRRARTCPVCEEVFPDRQAMARHIIMVHASAKSLLGWFCWSCWCNRMKVELNDLTSVDALLERFLSHCDRRGGVQAHYFACLLGVDG